MKIVKHHDMPATRPPRAAHLLSVMLEDYFHVRGFNHIIRRDQWYRFATRLEQNTIKTLDLLDRHQIKATFFVIGWIAEHQPEIVREVRRRGHEIAARGLYCRHRSRPMTEAEFRDEIRRTGDALERACGTRPVGFRAARAWSSESDLWALDVLASEGYEYDTSLLPTSQILRHAPHRRFAFQHESADGKTVWEFPVSTHTVGGLTIPIAGGNYFRQLPHTIIKRAVEHWDKNTDAPFAMYFHVWELDAEQPRIQAASQFARLRHYRKLDKISWVLEDYFKRYTFTNFADYLGLENNDVETEAQSLARLGLNGARAGSEPLLPTNFSPASNPKRDRAPVSVVVPCFNEEAALPYLANTLRSVAAKLDEEYETHFVFVDDCSTDGTWRALEQIFGAWPNCKIVRHEQNKGVAAAIRTGIRAADTEVVCSIDCDCTYDPHELRRMIPLLMDDVAMVTASPYHPRGAVRNVPAWRLSLSRASSFLYRRTLRQKLHTYTSCFRVYRRSAVLDIETTRDGFLGVAEMLGRLDIAGAKIVEHPATLEVRLFGQSKMKVARTIAGHLDLLARLFVLRLRAERHAHQASARGGNLPPVALVIPPDR